MLPTMRLAALCLLSVCAAWPQFRSTVQLVVAPVTITDSKGNFVDGLDASDLILYDNNVPQHTQVDSEIYPISLVGFFERSGTLGAGESARLDFNATEMNDVLKSLTIGSSGGKITGLRYDS